MDIILKKKINKIITLTFGCIAENNIGMEQVGKEISKTGFSIEMLDNVRILFEERGVKCIMYDLNEEMKNIKDYEKIEKARVLVIKEGVDMFVNSKELFKILLKLEWDKKYWDIRREDVFNKIARYNLIFSNKNQEPDYINKKGRIYNIEELEELNKLKREIEDMLGEDFKNLECEGNYYYDLNKCGIGYHGDEERKKVLGIRLGGNNDLHFRWYKNRKRVNNRISIPLENGDIYIMSSKASGNDWRDKNIYTLRHATGCEKFIK
tara:strand:+ start:357 stop:1151 length:795 start_codon:yes stop_codon:yes gene_type:complete